MSEILVIDEKPVSLQKIKAFIFRCESKAHIEISSHVKRRVEHSFDKLQELLKSNVPIYGVTTGFGDSCFRVIPPEKSEELQKNLILYLTCGTGKQMSKVSARATSVMRLLSLCQGYSGVSWDLIERLKNFLEKDWVPAIPREGSLGASGDLVPLAYLAEILQGGGRLICDDEAKTVLTKDVLSEAGLKPYVLKAKEGIALVNGTSAMAGLSLVNLSHAKFLLMTATLSSSWLCLALQGRKEAFSVLVNEEAKKHLGQGVIAKKIRKYLDDEEYQATRGQDVKVTGNETLGFIQDRYSLRCVPQILGPVLETIDQAWEWLEIEASSASDNPLINFDGNLEMGGNFYGGYLTHSMDYLKICLGQIADLQDRQLTFLIDEKSNRGLPPNLADWPSLSPDEKFLHHGLKGLHQAVSALTSELLSRSIPNSIFSRSSESHNQDKVSLGMSAAVQCSDNIDTLYSIQAMHLICLVQALDLRKISLKGETSLEFYSLVRRIVPFVNRDQALGDKILALTNELKRYSQTYEGNFNHNEKT